MKKTIAQEFTSDPRVVEAKRLVLEALADHKRGINGIRPPDPALKVAYDDLVTEFGELRAGQLFYPYLSSGIGNGALVELADGSVKYDFISGIGVHHFGHSHTALVEAALNAAMTDTVMQGNLQQHVQSVSLSRTLLSAANCCGATLKHCFVTTSGAMANENGLKLLFHRKSPANRVLAFSGCFAGRTLTLSQITDNPAYREGLPLNFPVDYVPFFDPERPEESTTIALNRLTRHLERYPGKHACMIFELVQGEGGFHAGSTGFFTALMEVLKQHNVAVMVDEIQTFSRTTELFAFQHFGLDRFVDVVTLGKSSQACATLFAEEFKPGPGLLSQTFTSSTLAMFVAEVIVNELLQGDYFGPDGRIARFHAHCVRRLAEIEEHQPGLIAGPYGVGAMIAFTAFSGDPVRVKQFVHQLFESGVISFYAGHDKLRVRFLIPVGAITFEDIDKVVSISEATLIKMSR